MNMLTFIRLKNRLSGFLAPKRTAQKNMQIFLNPRKFPLKDWEETAESKGERFFFGPNLSAIRWGHGPQKILLMHGWESRATQMYSIAEPLVAAGFEVIAIDAPLHGKSAGTKANPLVFAHTIHTANQALGPFYGAIGHSMGAAALAIAKSNGVNLGRYVLISSPACLYDTLYAFAKFMGLSEKCIQLFIQSVEAEVGEPSKALDVGNAMRNHDHCLLIHSKDDAEVPYAAMQKLIAEIPTARSNIVNNLGHRKIVRDIKVCEMITEFMIEQNIKFNIGTR